MQLPRFYPILDSALIQARGLSLSAAAAALLDGGARLLQFRHKGHYSRAIYEAAEAMAESARSCGATLVINDRADIALLLDAGVHVGQDDLPPVDVRRLLGGDRLVGFSTHNQQQVLAAAGEPADYIAIGPIFATATKSNPDPVVGVQQLKEMCALTAKPVVAIGGITLESAPAVLAAGARAVAVIGDLYRDVADHRSLRKRAAEWVSALGE